MVFISFWSLGAVLGFASFPDFLAVSALLEPANVPQTTELQGRERLMRVFKCTATCFAAVDGT